MKKVILLSLTIIFIFKTYGQNVTITGSIAHTPAQKVYLATGFGRKVDSAFIDKSNNSFTFKTDIKEETRFVIFYQKKGPHPLNQFIVKPGENVHFTYDVEDFKLHPWIKVTGSNATEEFIGLVERTKPIKIRVERLGGEIDSIRNFAKDTSSIAVKRKLRDSLEIQGNIIIKNVFDTTQSPINARQMLSFLKFSYLLKKDEAESLTGVLKLRFPEDKEIQLLNSGISGTEGQGLKLNTAAPNITLNNYNNIIISLSTLKNKYTLIDFWASWCKPCREENPNLINVQKTFENKGFKIFSVSIDTDAKAWRKAIEQDNTSTFIQVIDPLGFKSSYIKNYGIYALPANFLIDTNGKVVAKNLRGDELAKKLSELLP